MLKEKLIASLSLLLNDMSHDKVQFRYSLDVMTVGNYTIFQTRTTLRHNLSVGAAAREKQLFALTGKQKQL